MGNASKILIFHMHSKDDIFQVGSNHIFRKLKMKPDELGTFLLDEDLPTLLSLSPVFIARLFWMSFFLSSTVFTSFLLFGEMVIMTKCKMFAANTGFQYFSVEAHFRNIF